jgi:hypothetical protein
MFRSLYVASLVALASLAGCITTLQPAPPPPGVTVAEAPKLKPADYWEYMVRDAYTGSVRGLYRYTVSRADPDRVVVDVTRDGERVDTYIYTPDLKGLEHPLRNTQRLRYDPPYPAYAFPLYPGQRWRSVVTSTDPVTGKSYRTHVHAEVGEWRRIKVPAGEFQALPVRRSVYAGNTESFRLQEEIVETDWFAPSVEFPVASEGHSSHIDTSRGGGGRLDPPLRVRGDWLAAELVRYSGR